MHISARLSRCNLDLASGFFSPSNRKEGGQWNECSEKEIWETVGGIAVTDTARCVHMYIHSAIHVVMRNQTCLVLNTKKEYLFTDICFKAQLD